MDRSKINPKWPNALRWFLVRGLQTFTPWHFIREPDELASVAEAFKREDIHRGEVFVFARRQDCDDFAGLEISSGNITGKVICFHPTFSTSSTSRSNGWDIVDARFEDVFLFIAARVIPDMKDWAMTEDADDHPG